MLPDLLLIQSPPGCRTILLPRVSSALCTADLPALPEFPRGNQDFTRCIRFHYRCRFSSLLRHHVTTHPRTHRMHNTTTNTTQRLSQHMTRTSTSTCSSMADTFQGVSQHNTRLDGFNTNLQQLQHNTNTTVNTRGCGKSVKAWARHLHNSLLQHLLQHN